MAEASGEKGSQGDERVTMNALEKRQKEGDCITTHKSRAVSRTNSG